MVHVQAFTFLLLRILPRGQFSLHYHIYPQHPLADQPLCAPRASSLRPPLHNFPSSLLHIRSLLSARRPKSGTCTTFPDVMNGNHYYPTAVYPPHHRHQYPNQAFLLQNSLSFYSAWVPLAPWLTAAIDFSFSFSGDSRGKEFEGDGVILVRCYCEPELCSQWGCSLANESGDSAPILRYCEREPELLQLKIDNSR